MAERGSPAIRALVRRIANANPLWGVPRVHGEPPKLGSRSLSERTVSRGLALPKTPIAFAFLKLRAGAGMVPVSMIATLAALLVTRSTVRSRLDLQAEVLAVRHQLGVLQREAPAVGDVSAALRSL